MTFDDYQQAARQTAIYPAHHAVVYPALGLAGEAGELANAVKKVLRDDGESITDERREQLIAECGDVLWYLAAFAGDLGVSLSDVAKGNLRKLMLRRERGTLQGAGDAR